ncbi:Ubiquitin-conjugating enzyme/RWD-like protein [Pseudocohnilembus persalinus]|uniref:Ubiquitin-conjugating enzyme/RWD-like protein n=1 Tax=Pseudocohnilembus persalinus TaxID=266149 RepID=A0A0V0R795_PSEPJ|nr:Ubiquitin-conjugating enzyme/RWD-like protein [Pseudocohnilembus persalinus]|eukprot:KRX10367.1 Ubiquitin-conjugating enzyme/RWD-like protein [Pseudocohnilembus persalinus]
MATTAAQRRLLRDFKKLQEEQPEGITASPLEDDIFQWEAIIFGPDDTPWEGGSFELKFEFTEDYPNKPPQIKFKTALYHPNIYKDGSICLDILQNQWSPIYDVQAILIAIRSLLNDPNPNSPANAEAARLYLEDRKEYIRRVQEVVEKTFQED